MSTRKTTTDMDSGPMSFTLPERTAPERNEPSPEGWPGLARAIKEAGERLQTQYGELPIPASVIRREAVRLGPFTEASIIPSDYCYNLINKDPNSFRYPVFVRVERSKYKYV